MLRLPPWTLEPPVGQLGRDDGAANTCLPWLSSTWTRLTLYWPHTPSLWSSSGTSWQWGSPVAVLLDQTASAADMPFGLYMTRLQSCACNVKKVPRTASSAKSTNGQQGHCNPFA